MKRKHHDPAISSPCKVHQKCSWEDLFDLSHLYSGPGFSGLLQPTCAKLNFG